MRISHRSHEHLSQSKDPLQGQNNSAKRDLPRTGPFLFCFYPFCPRMLYSLACSPACSTVFCPCVNCFSPFCVCADYFPVVQTSNGEEPAVKAKQQTGSIGASIAKKQQQTNDKVKSPKCDDTTVLHKYITNTKTALTGIDRIAYIC